MPSMQRPFSHKDDIIHNRDVTSEKSEGDTEVRFLQARERGEYSGSELLGTRSRKILLFFTSG